MSESPYWTCPCGKRNRGPRCGACKRPRGWFGPWGKELRKRRRKR